MTIPSFRRIAAPSVAPFLLALSLAAGCGVGVDPAPASFEPNAVSRYGSAWTVTGTCGNGTLDAGEACDDGNALSGDGCSATCTIETDYTCTNTTPVALVNAGFNAQGASIAGATGNAITGWTVTAGNVDLVVPVEPQASWLITAEGTGMIDLAGTANGAVGQNIATASGRGYTVHFAYAARCPSTAPCTRTFQVDLVDGGGTTLTTAKFTGNGDPQPAWQIGTVFFKAIGTSTTVRFTGTDLTDTTNGALIDAVSIPATTCYLVPQLSCMTPQSALGDLSLNGVASVGATSIVATPSLGTQLGAVFSTRTFAPSSFTAVARLRIGSPSATPGDGFALVFQNDPRGPASIGCPGEGLGYGQQPGCTTPVISPSVAVELDTYFNAAWDTGYPNPHIAIDANGNVLHASPAVMPSFPMVSATFTVWADYNLATRTMQVFGSAGTVKPATPILVFTLTPAQAAVFDNPFYAGITGSTGGSYESQEILYYSISTTGIADANGDGLDDRCNTCGNGYVDAVGEECDDANTVSGDGCSATCKKEAGIVCAGVPSVCSSRCGDGIVSGTESCDDGNTVSGDGCSGTCQVETGFVCSAPSATNTLITVDASTTGQCAATGSASTFLPTTLPAGRYGLYYESGAAQVTATPTYQVAIEARSSTNGTTWTNTPIVSASAASSPLAIGNAVGNRGFFNTNGSLTYFFFPDASCGNNSGADVFRLRGVSLCQQIPDTSITGKPASLSNLAGPTFTFTASVAGSTFECSLDGAAYAACTSPRVYAGLLDGPHAFAVRAVNGAAVDPTPATWAWTIDTVAAAPVISFPGGGTQVPGSPTVTGTAEAGGSVTVREGATTLCTVTADSAGNWTCATTLGNGSHTLAATQTDLAGNTSTAANVTFDVATTLPAIALAAPAVIWSGNAAAYPVSGTCGTADGTVTVTVGSATSSPACTGGGTFSTSINVTALPDAGSVTVTASQTNVIGTGTASRVTRKDTVALAPTIAAPADGSLVAANPSVSGEAEPGASVTVKNGAATLCSVAANAAGAWICGTTLTEAAYTLSVTQVDVAGNASAAATVDFTVVTAPVVAITSGTTIFSGNASAYPVTGACKTLAGQVTVAVGTVTGSATCTGSAFTATLDVHLLSDGPSLTVTATQSNPAGSGTASRSVVKDTVALPPALASPAEGSEAAVNPTLSGNTEDFATVTVKEGATTLCNVTANSSGNWSCATTLGAGSHTLTSTMVDAAGNASGTATRNFTVVGPPVVTVNAPAQILGSNVAAYPIAGTCTTGAGAVSISVGTRTPTTTTCTGAGTFSGTFNATTEPDAPSVPVIASQTNGSGTGSDSKSTLKDATAAPPAIAFPINNATVPVTPTFTGTGEPGATVVVTDPGLPVATCTTTVDAGANWSCTFGALPTGTRTFSAVQTDIYGNGSGATTRSVTVSVTVNVPTIGLLVPITGANAAAYTVTGTCTIGGGNVTIRVGTTGAVTYTAVACTAAGTYSASGNVTGLADGASIRVRAQQGAGATLGEANEYTRKDTTAAAPVITAPANNGTTPTTTTIAGTSEVGASVTVTEGSALCTVTATSAGTWSCTLTLSLGVHAITARQTDIDGNVSAAFGPTNFIVVPVPSVTLAAPAVIAAANAAAFPVSGTCVTGAGNVTITIGAVSATPACTSAAFSATLDVSAVADASSVLVGATQANVAGSSTDTKTTRKDTVAAAPAITTPGASAEVPPSPAITGSGEPGATVTVKEGAPTVCTATVDGAGNWSCATTLALGAHSVTATQVDTAGNTSAASTARSFTCAAPPTVALAAPAVINAANAAAYGVSGSCTTAAGDVTLAVGTIPGTASCIAGGFSASLDVTALTDAASVTVTASQTNGVGTGTDSRTTRKDTVANPPAFTAPVASAEVAANPTISGTSEAGASVTVWNGAATVCTATADGSGSWTCSSTLGVGSYSLTSTQTDTAGNTSAASAAHAFTVVDPPVVTLTTPGPINVAMVATYSVSGTCTGTWTVDLQVGTFSTATACTASAFNATLDVSSVTDAPSVTVSASQTNGAGTRTDSKNTVKDTVAPAAPAIAAPASGAEVASNPTLSGTSEAGAAVTVNEGVAIVCTATANGSGAWSCATSLGDGAHSLTAKQTDTAGNPSVASAPHPFWIGIPVVALDPPATIFSGNVSAYAVSGTCTGAADVTVSVDAITAVPAPGCSAGTFAVMLDLSSVSDAASVTVNATQANVAGTGSDSAAVLKDTVALPPLIASPVAGSAVAASPGLSGTSEPGAEITVTELATTVCTATADGVGDWSCATTLGNGPHTLAASQVDAAGNSSVSSADHSFFVGSPAVALALPPTITSANVPSYTVSGTCSVGQGDVTVSVGAVSATPAPACAGGAFTATFDVSAVSDATIVSVTASQTNAVGTGSDTRTARKDTVALQPIITTPLEGASTSPAVTFSGSAEPGAALTVVEGATLCTATADLGGNWSCEATLTLGGHTVLVTQIDPDLNASAASSRGFTVIDLPVLLVDPPAVINAANVASYPVGGDCTTSAGTVTVDVGGATTTTGCSLGRFGVSFDVSLAPDAASVTITATQTNASGTGSGSKTTLKDTALPAAPAVGSPAAGAEVAARPTFSGTAEPGATVTVLDGSTPICTAIADGAGAWSCTPASDLTLGAHSISTWQADPAGNAGAASAARSVTVVTAPVVALAAPAVISSANAASFPVSGTCANGYAVSLTVGTAIGSTPCIAGAFATWLDVTTVTDADSVTVTASQTNAAGTGIDSRTTRKDAQAPAAPAIVTPAAAAEVAPNPTLSGTGEGDAIVTVREGATIVCSATTSTGGAWSCSTTLALGSHTLTATQTDTAGNVSVASAARTFEVVATPVVALAPPAVIFSGNAASYPVAGSCSGSAAVNVDVGGLTTTAACTAGAFAATLDVTSLPDAASVSIAASQTSASGTGSDSATVLKDTSASPPAITSPAPGAEVTARPTFSGTAEPGATVTVRDGASTVCSGIADGSGNWSCAATADLAPGARSIAATQTDTAGNTSTASGALSLTVVAAPIVTLPAPVVIFSGNAATYTVAGTCTGTGPVALSVGTASFATACTGGAFSASLDVTAVPDAASVAVAATQTNAAGTGAQSTTVLKDTVAAAPVLISPTASGSVGLGPSISGTAEPFATVAVTESAAPICIGAVTADAAGNWSCATALGVGPHAIDARQTDTAGNNSAATTRSFTVDVALPVVTLDPLDVINGANVAAFTITGHCTAGESAVTLTLGAVIATPACGVSGTFTSTLDLSSLAESPSVSVQASQTSAGGTSTDVQTTPKDTVANPPAVASPAAGLLVAPNPTITGTAEPFATVSVTESGATVCTGPVTAAASGDWSCATTLGLGPHAILASQTDPAGNVSAGTTRSFTVVGVPVVTIDPLPTINLANRGAYAVIGACDAAAGSVTIDVGGVGSIVPCTGSFSALVDVTSMADGLAIPVTATQTNASGTGTDSRNVAKDVVALAPAILSPAIGATVAPNPIVSGTSEPGASVAVSEGTLLCTATADGLGQWSCATSLGVGAHTVEAVQTDLAGNVSGAASRSFGIDAVPAVALNPPAIINLGNRAAYPVSGSCSGTTDVTVSVGAVNATVPCSAGGFVTSLNVSAVTDALVVTVGASQSNATGIGSDARPTLKDTAASPPAVLAPTEGLHVATARPTFSGTAEPGAVVTIVVAGVGIGNVSADGAGNWNLTPSADLGPGANTASVTQQDPAGNTSAATVRAFEVDTGVAPTIDNPVANSVVDFDMPVVLAGTAAPGATVNVLVDGTPVGTVTADGTSGRWSLTVPARTLAPSAHSATAAVGTLTSAAQPFTVRLPEVQLTGGGCGCQGGGGSGGWLALMAVLGVALRRRKCRVNLSA